MTMTKYENAKYITKLKMEDSERVIVEFVHELDYLSEQKFLMELEALLQKTVEPKLHLYVEPKKDINKIRNK